MLCKRTWNRKPPVHVRHHPNLRLVFAKRHKGRFFGRVYDELDFAEPAADYLQYGIGASYARRADCVKFHLRNCGGRTGASVFCRSEKQGTYFNFSTFSEPHNRDTDPNIILRFLKNVWRNVKATGVWFLLGIALSAVFQRYVPAESMGKLFGKEHEGFGLLMAATIGVPLYVCGGGTIPLLIQWLADGMSAGSAAAFMITGPATKITNLGALKIALGAKHFALYIAFVIVFSLLCGFAVNNLEAARFIIR